MPVPEVAIRAKRKLTNRLIAAHDAARLRPHLTDDMLLIVGDGELIRGADALLETHLLGFLVDALERPGAEDNTIKQAAEILAAVDASVAASAMAQALGLAGA